MKSLASYFQIAADNSASDLHLVGGEAPMIRVEGELKALDDKKLNEKELADAIFDLLTTEQKKKIKEELELDFGHVANNIRFRINLHWQEGRIGLSARLIPKDIPTPTDLRFEEALLGLGGLMNGLVLIVGPPGQGKSTVIASIIEEINKTRRAHIVTIEDPIEFEFIDKKSLIEQREVGIDTKSFAEALKHVLRQDPNIIFVGEMRDPETIATVLTAAETGHLVFSTLHTGSAAEAIERMVDVFEGSKQKQILIQLSSVLRAVVAQQLLPAKNGKLVAAREILIKNSAIANLIKENNMAQIPNAIQTGAKDGMITMETSIKKLLESDIIDENIAARRSGKRKKY